MNSLVLASSEPSPSPSLWRGFRRRFQSRAARPLPSMSGSPLDPGAAPLAAVLARFQLGETGEGRVAREIDDIHLPGIDDDYRQALKLFVKEEGRHARILALMVRSLGGQLLAKRSSDRLFRRSRHLLGLRFKLVVLLVAEVVGGEVYAALGAAVADPSMAEVLGEMAADEREHLAFHAAFLRGRACTAGRRRWLRLGFWMVAAGAALVVLAENARDLRALGLTGRDLGRRLGHALRAADGAAFALAAGAGVVAVTGEDLS